MADLYFPLVDFPPERLDEPLDFLGIFHLLVLRSGFRLSEPALTAYIFIVLSVNSEVRVKGKVGLACARLDTLVDTSPRLQVGVESNYLQLYPAN